MEFGIFHEFWSTEAASQTLWPMEGAVALIDPGPPRLAAIGWSGEWTDFRETLSGWSRSSLDRSLWA